jgi:AraC family transcriptional regulator of adaptative response / DNA-3-methyladenine glycosylase II
LAPRLAGVRASATLASRAAVILEESCGILEDLKTVAERLGRSERQVRRAFMEEYQATPIQHLQTCRLLLAKSLLTDTSLSVVEVAMAAGFGSLRRFNDLFKKRYGLVPTALRRKNASVDRDREALEVTLSYFPPYRWDQILGFLAARAIEGVEKVENEKYFRVVNLQTPDNQWVQGWLSVGHQPALNALLVTIGKTLLPVLPLVLARVRHLFDLGQDPEAIFPTLSPLNELRPGLFEPGTRLPGSFDAFETALRAILGQRITIKGAGGLAARLVAAYGAPVQTGIPGLTRVFPGPRDILALTDDPRSGPLDDRLGPLGVTTIQARAIGSLARALFQGEIDLSLWADPEMEMLKLQAIAGIGPWTAKYIAMRVLGHPDVFLETDLGIRKALAGFGPPKGFSPRELAGLAEAWRPWRSYATVNLWNSL